MASTNTATYYHVSPKRKSLIDGLLDTVVHDHWKSYYNLEGVEHGLCNQHHLRELKSLIEYEKEAWATGISRLLRVALRCRHFHGTNAHGNVLYTGVTNDLIRRVYEHKNKMVAGFTQKYNVGRLVYFEVCPDIMAAIAREKQIKGWSRKKKDDLLNALNSEWADFYPSLC